MKKLAAALSAALVLSCKPEPSYPTLDPSQCKQACEVVTALDCKTKSGHPYSQIIPGIPCDDGCRKKIADGLDIKPSCVATSKTCQEVDACARR